MILWPVLFKFGGFTIYSFGFLLAVAFLASILIARRELSRKGMEADLAYDLAIYAMIGGLAGGRVAYVLGHLEEFAGKPLSALAIWQGGLVFYGGLAGGTLAVLSLLWRRGLKTGKIADVIAPCLAVGSAIGRLGCFSNGCCYGASTKLPWAVTFTDPRSAAPLGIAMHPTQLYEFGYNIVIFAILWSLRKKVEADGLIFWLYIGLYGVFRLVVEFLRVRPILVLGLGGSQLFSLAMIAASILMIGFKYAGGRNEVGNQAEA
ncbi:MAG: prolipoprotein diacylglyceryl transferase [Actinobacteria bacterium]|nr:prolipoprotein diacylglyceryl transferase [Actinomycetota bacterium]